MMMTGLNRVYIDEVNKYLCYNLNGINFINQTDWTLQDGSLKPDLFYANKLHLIKKERNAKLAVSIHNSINPNATINKSVSVSLKLFACHTGLNLKQEDFAMLHFHVSVRNSVCNSEICS